VTDADTQQHCAFHPDRRAGVVCQRCDKYICPACMHQASVGFHCPDCVRQGRQKVVRGNAAFGRTPSAIPVTMGLIAINVVVFLIQIAAGDEFVGRINIGNKVIHDYGLNAGAISDGGEWYRIITSAFLHANLIHLLFNMYALYIIGPTVERALGPVRYVIVYATALLAGSAGALIVEPDALTVGASGAIYGLLGALIVLFRNRGISIWQSGLAITLFLNLVITLSISNISIGGHIGGLVGGATAAFVIIEGPRYVRNRNALVWVAGALVPVFFLLGMVVAGSSA
jgi:membrane associated rhomboid family serine protease